MEVLGTFRPEDVLPHIAKAKERRGYRGDDGRLWNVKMWSHRYFTFRRSLSCVVCGLDGTVMSLERSIDSDGQPHFNLYAVGEGGERTLMTKDHIRPRSRGGEDYASNFQTMCAVCNGLKAHHSLDLRQMKLLRAAYDTLMDRELPKEVRRVIDGMAVRMVLEDSVVSAMTAGELAKILSKTPDAIVAVRDSAGCCLVMCVTEVGRDVADSDNLPPRFIVIKS